MKEAAELVGCAFIKKDEFIPALENTLGKWRRGMFVLSVGSGGWVAVCPRQPRGAEGPAVSLEVGGGGGGERRVGGRPPVGGVMRTPRNWYIIRRRVGLIAWLRLQICIGGNEIMFLVFFPPDCRRDGWYCSPQKTHKRKPTSQVT